MHKEIRNSGISNQLSDAHNDMLKALELTQSGDLKLARAAVTGSITKAQEALHRMEERCMIADEIMVGLS